MLFGACSHAWAECSPDEVTIRSAGSLFRFSVEVADDNAERATGLMNRQSLPRFGSMLFVYERPQPMSFWMKNTLIPLDMLFLDAGGTVVDIHENAVPEDLTPITADGLAQYVLEINGGLAAQLGIREGAELRHPSLDQANAAWPCD